jgi:putative redox protein
MDNERIEVRRQDRDRYEIRIRDHTLVVDQPGSGDAGPTPTEIWVGGLASCVAYYAGTFLTRHGIDATDLRVRAAWRFAEDRPARVGDVAIEVDVPSGFPPELADRFHAVVTHCTVHNSMKDPPSVSIELRTPAMTP